MKVWTDVVSPDCEHLITLYKGYEVTGEIREDISIVHITSDTGAILNILIGCGCAFLDGNKWNIEPDEDERHTGLGRTDLFTYHYLQGYTQDIEPWENRPPVDDPQWQDVIYAYHQINHQINQE